MHDHAACESDIAAASVRDAIKETSAHTCSERVALTCTDSLRKVIVMKLCSQLLGTTALLCALGAVAVAGSGGAFIGQDHGSHGQAPAAASKSPDGRAVRVGDPYVLDIDPVTGKSLGPIDHQIVQLHEGREFRFATNENSEAFNAAPSKYIANVDAKLVAIQKPLYPISTCVVSGEKLGGEMGDPVDRVIGNRLVRFCCSSCVAKFQKEPVGYFAKLDTAAIEAQRAKYALKNCVVSKEKLGGEKGDLVDRVVGGRLVRFCCESCIGKFEKDPVKFFAALDREGKPGAENAPSSSAVTYTCSMHADVVKDKPGRCPKCGMELVKKK